MIDSNCRVVVFFWGWKFWDWRAHTHTHKYTYLHICTHIPPPPDKNTWSIIPTKWAEASSCMHHPPFLPCASGAVTLSKYERVFYIPSTYLPIHPSTPQPTQTTRKSQAHARKDEAAVRYEPLHLRAPPRGLLPPPPAEERLCVCVLYRVVCVEVGVCVVFIYIIYV